MPSRVLDATKACRLLMLSKRVCECKDEWGECRHGINTVGLCCDGVAFCSETLPIFTSQKQVFCPPPSTTLHAPRLTAAPAALFERVRFGGRGHLPLPAWRRVLQDPTLTHLCGRHLQVGRLILWVHPPTQVRNEACSAGLECVFGDLQLSTQRPKVWLLRMQQGWMVMHADENALSLLSSRSNPSIFPLLQTTQPERAPSSL